MYKRLRYLRMTVINRRFLSDSNNGRFSPMMAFLVCRLINVKSGSPYEVGVIASVLKTEGRAVLDDINKNQSRGTHLLHIIWRT
ncbi:hypothetical protein TcasGA2_TC007137 [Tribolium castaneum]|uniref:Uncharacterized protein n=1 Tax=Tribolium castaneum TaxID=7070 RepID=D2A178_TRICA|nr:hypothetical protein TcasGA2_TC007137 [Tribolium castaneum]